MEPIGLAIGARAPGNSRAIWQATVASWNVRGRVLSAGPRRAAEQDPRHGVVRASTAPADDQMRREARRNGVTASVRVGLALCLLVAASGCLDRRPLEIPGAAFSSAPGDDRVRGESLLLDGDAEARARLRFRSVWRWRVRVIARGVPAVNGEWPKLQLRMPGTFGKSVVVTGDRKAIDLNLVSEPGFADLSLALVNPAAVGGPSVRIERVEITPVEPSATRPAPAG